MEFRWKSSGFLFIQTWSVFPKYLKRSFGVFDCISALIPLDLPPVNLRGIALKYSQIHSKLHLPAFRNTLWSLAKGFRLLR